MALISAYPELRAVRRHFSRCCFMSLSDRSSSDQSAVGLGSVPTEPVHPPPVIPDHELLQRVGRGSYGEVWLARNALGWLRAVKIVYRGSFDHDKPYEREFEGLKKFEPVSHARESQIDVFHAGRNDQAGFFYYIMELADRAELHSSQTKPCLKNSGLIPSDPRVLNQKSQIVPKVAAPFTDNLPGALPGGHKHAAYHLQPDASVWLT